MQFNMHVLHHYKTTVRVQNEQKKNRSLWTRAHLAFMLRTQNLVLVAKGDHFGRKILEKLQNSQNWPF